MKLNPYPVLLTTGALMFATVLFAQTGPGVALLQQGAASVDRDVSSFAAKTFSPGPGANGVLFASKGRVMETRLVLADKPSNGVSED